MNIGVTGHQRIPDEARAYVERGLDEFLRGYDGADVTGLSSMAYGADQLFADAMLRAGHPVTAIIPCRGYRATFTGEGLAAYDRLMEQVRTAVTLDFPEPGEDAYLAAGKRVVDESDILVAFWDGLPAAGKGGTGDAVAYAKARRKRVVVIWPEGVRH
ncbi:hypothetical protein JS531_02040 [Bifidobacterium sp. CP2]|uniref:hypothetical protein n=1 Tax=Bifidobacterium TaxID=1678 RepID=UPI001BDBF1DC|nr:MULTISPECIES: hypothetical protein [Bifidobacterium]MBT1180771.1 hypothetical protein [Bifidobacterium sp. CP2]MBW3080211.1 hypothetical protein [Bifidobacterium saguinibicoloris]